MEQERAGTRAQVMSVGVMCRCVYWAGNQSAPPPSSQDFSIYISYLRHLPLTSPAGMVRRWNGTSLIQDSGFRHLSESSYTALRRTSAFCGLRGVELSLFVQCLRMRGGREWDGRGRCCDEQTRPLNEARFYQHLYQRCDGLLWISRHEMKERKEI